MKGTLLKTESGWMVRKECEILDGVTGVVEYPLHPSDVEKINEWGQMFDHIESRIASAPEVNFSLLGLVKCTCQCHSGSRILHFSACCHNGYKGPVHAKLDNNI